MSDSAGRSLTEIEALRSHVRDLASLLALPAMWRRQEPELIAGSVLDALHSLVRLDVAYMRLSDPEGGTPHEVWRPLAADAAPAPAALLAHWRTAAVAEPGVTAIGHGKMRVLQLDPVLDRERAVVWLASRRSDFPTELESFLCGVAIDQAMTSIRAARLLRELQHANSAKSSFLATMSHELRTPLNAIIGYTDLLEAQVSGPITEGQRMQLGRIRLGASHLIQLIEEILTFSRVEAGREQLDIAEVDIAEVAREACRLAEPLGAQKEFAFSYDVPSSLLVETDAGKVRQMLLNLLSNAVKFTDRGTVRLAMSTHAEQVVITVEDTGIGIQPRHLEHIFEPFSQVERKLSRRTGGTGLGLAVTRQLARLLGGDVSVVSTPGRGSTFTLQLPMRAAAVSADTVVQSTLV